LGVGSGSKVPPGFQNLTFSNGFSGKKVVFLDSSGENEILPLLAPLQKYFWPTPGKSTFGPCLEKSFRRPCLGVHAHLSKCWRGTWPEKVLKTLSYTIFKRNIPRWKKNKYKTIIDCATFKKRILCKSLGHDETNIQKNVQVENVLFAEILLCWHSLQWNIYQAYMSSIWFPRRGNRTAWANIFPWTNCILGQVVSLMIFRRWQMLSQTQSNHYLSLCWLLPGLRAFKTLCITNNIIRNKLKNQHYAPRISFHFQPHASFLVMYSKGNTYFHA